MAIARANPRIGRRSRTSSPKRPTTGATCASRSGYLCTDPSFAGSTSDGCAALSSINERERPGSKLPISTLVIVYTPDLRVLMLERADFPEHWQSVTGSQEPGETLLETATRELFEETGLDA